MVRTTFIGLVFSVAALSNSGAEPQLSSILQDIISKNQQPPQTVTETTVFESPAKNKHAASMEALIDTITVDAAVKKTPAIPPTAAYLQAMEKGDMLMMLGKPSGAQSRYEDAAKHALNANQKALAMAKAYSSLIDQRRISEAIRGLQNILTDGHIDSTIKIDACIAAGDACAAQGYKKVPVEFYKLALSYPDLTNAQSKLLIEKITTAGR